MDMYMRKCKMCGAVLEPIGSNTVVFCQECGLKQTFPRINNESEEILYKQANDLRLSKEYEKAKNIYEIIVKQNQKDPEAYLGMVLCKYGISYVKDPYTNKIQPKINIDNFERIYNDYDYKMAVSLADNAQRAVLHEIARAIEQSQNKVADLSSVKTDTVQNDEPSNVDALLTRLFILIEDGEWAKAEQFTERILNAEPENAEAYLGKLMINLRVNKREFLPECPISFEQNKNYVKAVRFGDKNLVNELEDAIKSIKERNKFNHLNSIYNDSLQKMGIFCTEPAFKSLAVSFKSLGDFKDSSELAEECLERAEVCRKDAIYNSATANMQTDTIQGCQKAIELFKTISGHKDADDRAEYCAKRAVQIQEITDQQIAEYNRQLEEQRIAKEKAAKKRKKIALLVLSAIMALIIFVLVLIYYIIPNGKYKDALKLMNNGKYEDAIAELSEIRGFKDADDQYNECLYQLGSYYYENHDWDTANSYLEQIRDYKDAKNKIHYHEYKSREHVDPTCDTNGYDIKVCSCGEETKETIASLGHNYKSATCTEPETCTRCNTTRGEALGHTANARCTRCNTVIFKTIKYSGSDSREIQNIYLPKGDYKIKISGSSTDSWARMNIGLKEKGDSWATKSFYWYDSSDNGEQSFYISREGYYTLDVDTSYISYWTITIYAE